MSDSRASSPDQELATGPAQGRPQVAARGTAKASRKGQDRVGGRGGSAGRRPRFTGRAAVLVLVLCSLVAALAYPTRQFVAQRSQIAQQRSAAEQAQAQVDELRREKARWQDPAYVATQARERLHYGFPGETQYTSIDPGVPAVPQPKAAAAAVAQPWYDSLFQSLDAADAASAPR